MGKIKNDQSGFRRNRFFQSIVIDVKVRIAFGRDQRQMDRFAAREGHRGFVRVVGRIEDDNFITPMNDRVYGRKQRLRRAIGHRHLSVSVDLAAIEISELVGDGMAQRRRALHRRVLVRTVLQVVIDAVQQSLRRLEARKPL